MTSRRTRKSQSKMKLRIRNRLQLRTHIIVGSIIIVLTTVFSAMFFLGDTENARASSSGDYRTRQSGNWNGSSTWEKFNGWYWANTSQSPDEDNNAISILSGHTVTLTSGESVDELTIEAGGTLIANNGDLKIENGPGVDITVHGTLTLNTKIKLEKNSSMAIYGTVNENSDKFDLKDHTDIYVYSGGTVVYNGGNLEDNSGDWHFYNGSTFMHNRNGEKIVKAFWAANSTCLIAGTTNSFPGNLNQTFGNFTINTPALSSNKELGSELDDIKGNFTVISTGTGSVTLSKNSNKTIEIGGNYIHQGGTLYITEKGDGNLDITGDMIVSSGLVATSNDDDGGPTINIDGNLTISSGVLDLSQYSGSHSNKGNGTVNLKGDLNITGGQLKETASGAGNGILNFIGNSEQNFVNTGSISNTINAEVKNGAILNMSTYSFTGSGSFTVASGATLRIGSPNGITASGASGNVQVTGTRSFSTNASYEYVGSSTQVTGNGLPSTVANITVDNSSGLTLSGSISSKGEVALTNGVVTTGSNSLIVGTSILNKGSITRTNGWVNGNLSRWIPLLATGSFVFPVGVSSYNEYTATYSVLPTAGGLMTVKFVQSNPMQNGLPLLESNSYKVNTIGTRGYWTVSSSLGLVGGVYSISVLGSGFTGISDVSNVRILSRLGTSLPWTLLGSHTNATGSISNVRATRIGLGLPTQITIGWGYDALPIELIVFDAKVNGDKVDLSWSTAAEINNDYFTLERSDDGRNYDNIGIVRGSGNTTTQRDYTFTDDSPLNGESYYRLRQTDYDGKFEIFDPKHISIKKNILEDSKLTIWPNPFSDRFEVEMEAEESGELSISIIGMDGRAIKTESMLMNAPGIRWSFNDGNNLLPGTYILRLQLNEEVLSRKIVKR